MWIGLGVFFVLGVPALLAANAIPARSHFSEFLVFDDNPAALVQLSSTHPEAFAQLSESSLNEVFDFLFLKNQRLEARKWVQNLYRGSACPIPGAKAKFCDSLLQLWRGPLWQTYFWDASLVQLSRARELVATPGTNDRLRRDACLEARSILSDLESREGAMGPLLETQIQVFECLGDESARNEVYLKLETLRNIQSALGT
ncbi:MAG TPA: hypothetical protein VM901_06425 [Bdellovibrionota bacterium]|nr:hypothetical protein [Bdellovibrionota bacterium]